MVCFYDKKFIITTAKMRLSAESDLDDSYCFQLLTLTRHGIENKVQLFYKFAMYI